MPYIRNMRFQIWEGGAGWLFVFLKISCANFVAYQFRVRPLLTAGVPQSELCYVPNFKIRIGTLFHFPL